MARNTLADATAPRTTLFLLSPSRCGGERGLLLSSERGTSELAQRLRTPEGAPLGEVFAFLSALYFRGKLTYARAFARPTRGVPGVLVITPGEGLVPSRSRSTRCGCALSRR